MVRVMGTVQTENLFRRVKNNILHDDENANLIDSTPLALMHVGLVSVFFVPFSWFAVGVAAFLYFLRVFA